MRRWRATVGLVVGVALPTALLALGWLLASLRERGTLEREQRALLARSAEAVRAAVDESVEELRAREDARPFYLYNHWYSPPDLLSISDPVAVSPLAGEPDDPRVVGYFQVDPDGAVRTPYEAPDAPPRDPDRMARVLAEARAPALAEVRALASLGPMSRAIAQAAPAPEPPRPAPRPARPRPAPGTTASNGPPSSQGPLTISMNVEANSLARDIQEAQAGDPVAQSRVVQRGRQVPVTHRNPVSWEQQAKNQQAMPPPQAAPPQQAHVSGSPTPAPRLPRPRPRARPVAPAPAPVLGASIVQPDEQSVDYTPMAWKDPGAGHGAILLTRVVSHQGAAAVQGVVLDRTTVVDTWIPSVIARRALAGSVPHVLAGGEEAAAGRCDVTAPASHVLGDLTLCFPAGTLAAAVSRFDRRLHLQAALLAALLLVVGLAVWAVDRAGRRAADLSRQRSDFVAAVSHELRTPLTTIRMNAEMLRDGLVSADKRDRFFGDLVNETLRLGRLVENVLELSRLEAGRRRLEVVRADLGAHVQAVAARQARFVEAKGFTVATAVPAEPLEVLFDAAALEQVLVNLLDNAVKYAADARDRSIAVELERAEGRAVLRVLDHGPGIPADQRDRVFERFHRVPRAGKPNVAGTGLGLALVRDLARAHGGDATVHERPGGGTEVRVTLPTGTRPVP